jgi:hypothetical protein
MILLLGEMLTATAMASYEEHIANAVVLAGLPSAHHRERPGTPAHKLRL